MKIIKQLINNILKSTSYNFFDKIKNILIIKLILYKLMIMNNFIKYT